MYQFSGEGMSYLDKTFCASPNCKNDCGRRMTDQQRQGLDYHNEKYVSYGYFCGEPELIPTDTNEDLMPKETITFDISPPLPEWMTIIDGVQELAK